MARRGLVVIALAAGGIAAGAQPAGSADPCAAVLPNRDARVAAVAYERRAGGYCDGAVFEPQAGPGELAVVAVTRGPAAGTVPFDIRTDRGSVGSTGTAAQQLRVQGIPLSGTTGYRLDGVVAAGQSLTVGVDSAMPRFAPAIGPGAIAWSAWGETNDRGRLYYPVLWSADRSAPITIRVRPTIRTSYLAYTVRSEASGAPVLSDSIDGGDEGTVFAVDVPVGNASVLIVNLTAVGPGGRTQAAVVRIAVPSV